jgi:hypothetical protein
MVAVPRQQMLPWRERTCLEAALQYAGREGVPVFPVNGKIPFAGSHGFHDATTRRETIVKWWKRWPRANIGIPTGKRSGWLVVDIDPRHEGFVSFERLLETSKRRAESQRRPFEPLPPTRSAYSGGGGLHLIFAARSDLEMRNTTALGGYPGLDVRGEGGYIVVPPSLHESGRRYMWMNDEQLAPFPDLLSSLHREWRERERAANQLTVREGREAKGEWCRPDFFLDMAVERAHTGTRHQYALYLACRLVGDAGLSFEQAERYIYEYVQRVPAGDHPFTINEAMRCLQWACEHM